MTEIDLAAYEGDRPSPEVDIDRVRKFNERAHAVLAASERAGKLIREGTASWPLGRRTRLVITGDSKKPSEGSMLSVEETVRSTGPTRTTWHREVVLGPFGAGYTEYTDTKSAFSHVPIQSDELERNKNPDVDPLEDPAFTEDRYDFFNDALIQVERELGIADSSAIAS